MKKGDVFLDVHCDLYEIWGWLCIRLNTFFNYKHFIRVSNEYPQDEYIRKKKRKRQFACYTYLKMYILLFGRK